MTGGCLCGAVRYECSGEPVFALLCHCRDCQRQSGSAYAAAVRLPAASFRVTQGAPKLYVKTADSGNQVSRAFCPECGCMLFLRVSARPDLVGIRVGTLDDPAALPPDVHIYTRSKLPWVALPQGIPAFEAYYDAKALWPAASLERRRAALD